MWKLPELKIPTDKEVRANTLRSWQAVEPVLLSGLHSAILELSMPTIFCHITKQEIVDSWISGFDGKIETPGSKLKQLASAALEVFPDGFFFKMDGRSPKDTDIIKYTNQNIHELPVRFFSSERMLDDLCVQTRHRDNFFMCFRKWVDLTDEQRVFVKDGKIQGVSRYNYHEPNSNRLDEWKYEEVAGDFLNKINPYMRINNYVFDFGFVDLNPVLIELNPYGLSDPCCFKTYDNIKGYKAD
jgi:hypothetical protein